MKNQTIQQAKRELAEEKKSERVEEVKAILRQIEALEKALSLLKKQIKEM